jgi:hypothetical protein
MIAPVRKFEVEHNGRWLPVFYIFEPSGNSGGSISYCVSDDEGKPILVPAANITGIKEDGNTTSAKKKGLEENLPYLRKNKKKMIR